MGRKYLPWRRRALRRPKGHNSIDLDKVGSSSDSDIENGNLEIEEQLDEAEANMIKNTNIEELNDDDDDTDEDEVYANDPFEGGSVFIGGMSQDDQPIIRTVKEAVIRSDIGEYPYHTFYTIDTDKFLLRCGMQSYISSRAQLLLVPNRSILSLAGMT